MVSIHSELTGRKAVAWVRCSSDMQAETSLVDQRSAIEAFATQYGIKIVHWTTLEGISASIERNLDNAIREIISVAQRLGADSLLVFDHTRFTRTGGRHGGKLLYDLETAGIELVTVLGYQPRNEYSDLLHTVNFVNSRQQARSIAMGSARGNQSSLIQGRRAPCAHAPYGIDKRIETSDGKPVYVTRDLPTGEQVYLSSTGEELSRSSFDRNGRPVGRLKKTRDHRVVLITGDPAAQRVVRRIYEEFFVQQYGVWRIAKALNDEGIPSHRGGLWSKITVKQVLLNTTYTGRYFANRVGHGIYYEYSPCIPKEVPFAKANQKRPNGRPVSRIRPKDEWYEVKYTELVNFLPAHIRDAAIAWQDEQLERSTRPRRPYRRHKHVDSLYFLSGLLVTKEEGLPLKGFLGSKRRYYGISRSLTAPQPNPNHRRRIRADHVERFVLDAIAEMLREMPSLKDNIVAQTLEWQRSLENDDGALLRHRLADLEERIGFIDTEIKRIGVNAARRRLDELIEEKTAVEARLGATSTVEQLGESEVVTLVNVLLDELADSAEELSRLAPAQLKTLAAVLIERAVVDLDKSEIEFVLRVPSWATAFEGCLEGGSARTPWVEAPPPFHRQTVRMTLPPPHPLGGRGWRKRRQGDVAASDGMAA